MATVKAYICLKHLKEGTILTGQGPHLILIFIFPVFSLSDGKFPVPISVISACFICKAETWQTHSKNWKEWEFI